MSKESVLNLVWFDDQKEILDKSIPSIKKEFIEKYEYDLNFKEYSDYDEFHQYLQKYLHKIDGIFLDINLGALSYSGVDIYEHIRKKNEKLPIVFISGHLNDLEWESKIEQLKDSDPNLNTIKLGFPGKRSPEYYKQVSTPIIKIINSKTQILEFPYAEYLKSKAEKRENLIESASRFNLPFANQLFKVHSDVNWVITGLEPGNILKKGTADELLTSQQLFDVSAQYGIMVSAFKRNPGGTLNIVENPMVNEYITQKKAISTQTILGKILHVDDDRVILKCLMDETNKKFEVREFDLEPLVKAVTLEINSIIEIQIITLRGERRFLFKDGAEEFQERFEKKLYFDKKDYSAFFNPEPNA